MDYDGEFKRKSKIRWASGSYADEVAILFPPMSSHLIRAAKVKSGDLVLDVACGSGNTAITASRTGAKVVGLDITPELLDRAKKEADIAEANNIEWKEGDAENLPFENNSFDIVLSSVGHMFAPSPEIVTKELIRVTKPDGSISFTTWPPEHAIGRIYDTIEKYSPPLSEYPPSPINWGIPDIINKYFENNIKSIHFERGVINIPMLSPNHYWHQMSTRYPVLGVVQSLNSKKVEDMRIDFIKAIEPFIYDNILKLDYLLTMAVKKEVFYK
ncbi:MAG: class I SAM-dependent methyltransferase [Nitrososphaeraceae archaeon]